MNGMSSKAPWKERRKVGFWREYPCVVKGEEERSVRARRLVAFDSDELRLDQWCTSPVSSSHLTPADMNIPGLCIRFAAATDFLPCNRSQGVRARCSVS